jgi:hypothetical protein
VRSREPSRTRERAARAAGCLLAAALGLGSGAAKALPAIGWEAPPGCPTAARVEARIREVVGARPVSDAVVAVHARVKRQGEGWLLVVVFTRRDGTTERRLTLHDCEATADATALLVGIALVGAPGSAGGEIPQAVPVPEARETDDGNEGTRARERGEAQGRNRAAARDEGAAPGRNRAGAKGEDEAQGRNRAAEGAAAGARSGVSGEDAQHRAESRAGRGSEAGAGAGRGGTAGAGSGPGGAAADEVGTGTGQGGAKAGAGAGQGGAAADEAGAGAGQGGAARATAGDARRRAAEAAGGARVRAFAQVGPAVAAGILPRATPGLTGALGVAWPRLRLALGYARLFTSEARWPEDRQIGADLSLHAAALRAGPVRRVGPVELHAGLGLEFGALRAQGFGSPTNFDRRTWWGAALVGGALAWAPRALRGHGALLVQAELVVPLHRSTLLVDDDPIFRLGAAGLRAGVQLEARLF